LRRLLRMGRSGRGNGIGDAQNAAAAACITADCEKGRLRTQDRHEAKGISEIRSAYELACLCGMCRCELLLTIDHRLLAWDVEGRDGADLLAHAGGKMNEISRRGNGGRNDCVEWTAHSPHRSVDFYSKLFATLPSLGWL